MILLLLAIACRVEPSVPVVPDGTETGVKNASGDTAVAVHTSDTGDDNRPNVDAEDAFFRVLATGDDSRSLGILAELVDLDLDGRLEAVVSWYSGTWLWSIPKDGGTVTTADALWGLEGEGTGWLAVQDFDGDGNEDLLTFSQAQFGDDLLRVHLAPFPDRGTVEFAGMAAGNGTPRVAVGDFNGDGFPDIAHVGTQDFCVCISVFYGPFHGNTSVEPGSQFSLRAQSSLSFVYSLGDLTADGFDNLIVRNLRNEMVRQPLLPGVFGEEIETEWLVESQSAWEGLRVEALRSLNDPALLVREDNGLDTTIGAVPIPRIGTGSSVLTLTTEASHSLPYLWAAGDVNGDGFSDVWVTTGSPAGYASLVLGPFEDGAVLDASVLWSYRIQYGVGRARIRDVDNDGVLDLLFASPGDGAYLHLIKDLQY